MEESEALSLLKKSETMIHNFEDYQIFYMVAKYNNITRAAEELYISQSSVSRSLQILESYLHCRLFERHRRGVRITPEGEVLYEKMKPVYQMMSEAETDFLSHVEEKAV